MHYSRVPKSTYWTASWCLPREMNLFVFSWVSKKLIMQLLRKVKPFRHCLFFKLALERYNGSTRKWYVIFWRMQYPLEHIPPSELISVLVYHEWERVESTSSTTWNFSMLFSRTVLCILWKTRLPDQTYIKNDYVFLRTLALPL